ncbi:venom allergen 5 [Phymastichus coffea]|uniref:venom allergen 5 n=1 Tax=Phymastichus coffea TaxID=108790 RepID=UPI00273C9E4A|nr:venom allergen 5 [Phymastichus coffea]
MSIVCLLVTGMLLSMLAHAPRCLACTGKSMIRTGVSCQDKRNILDEHNRLRQLVALGQVNGQPSAKMMMEMVWDDELAAMAQQWADRCSETHDNARNVQRFAVGQNMARTWTTRTPAGPYDMEPDWRQQIFSWFNEVEHYRTGLFSKFTAHYTQVIWGDTYLVGCGFSYYYDPIRGYTKNYVCNYGPSGNVLGYNPYSFGWPECNTYGMDYSNRYSGLCSEFSYNPLGAYCAYG